MNYKSTLQTLFHSSLTRLISFLSGLAVCIVIAGFVVVWSQSDQGYRTAQDQDELKIFKQSSFVESLESPETNENTMEERELLRRKDNSFSESAPERGSDSSSYDILNQRRLEQEIALSLARIEPIRNARVLLAIPRRPVEKASASVMIEMAGDAILSRQQIRSVVNLVAAAVPTLEMERVSLVDQWGRLLNSADQTVYFDVSIGQMMYQRNLEDYLNTRVENILAPLIGISGFRVEVTADLDFSGAGRTVQGSGIAYNRLLNASPVSTENPLMNGKTQTFELKNAMPGRTHDPSPKTRPSRVQRPSSTGAGQNQQGDFQAQPVLQRLSTVILLDNKLTIPTNDGASVKTISQEDIKRLSELVKPAIAFSGDRGDQLSISLAAFKIPQPEALQPAAPFWQQEWFLPLLKQGTAFLALLLLYFGVTKPLIRLWLTQHARVSREGQAVEKNENSFGTVVPEGRQFTSDSDLSGEPRGAGQGNKKFAGDVSEFMSRDIPASGRERLEYLKSAVEADAQTVAEVIKQWLKGKEKDVNQSEQAALLMLSIGKNRAAGILRHLAPKDVQSLGAAMLKAKDLSTVQIDSVVSEFFEQLKNRDALVVDKDEYVRSMLISALGEKNATIILERISAGVLTKGMEKFKWMDSHSITEMIGCEHPQIIAIVLSVLEPGQAAEVLAIMPENLRSDLMIRIAAMKGVQPSALKELDQIMAQQIPDDDSRNSTPMGGVEFAAHILNHMDSRFGDMILTEIEDHDHDLARAIQDKMFVFEDITHLEAKDIQTVLREISTSQLLLALTGAGESLKDKIFKNMSRRAVEMLKEDMALAPEAKTMEVEMARKEILNIVKKLADAGEIKIRVETSY